MRPLLSGKVLFISLLLIASMALAQTSRLDGTVTDPSGAVVAGVQVSVTNVETRQIYTAVSNDHGLWVVPGVAAGTYKISLTRTGFKTKSLDDVVINAGVPATVNAALEAGAVTETVEVSAGAEILQTSTAGASTTAPT